MALNKEQEIEIQNAISQSKTTIRPVSEALESLLYKPIELLDHGFVRVIDYMGNDSAIVQAARVSYGTGTKQVSNDKGLIDYLMSHRHSSPFEMCEIKLHVKMPIFVARQWIRHRMASINEYSARYSIMDNEFYVPNASDILPQSSTNNQGRDENKQISPEEQREVIEILKADSMRNYNHYTKMMNKDEDGNVIDEGKVGIARELARMNLSLNFYTQFYWKIDLHNLLHFLRLRADGHAQYEIRVYADAILDIVKSWVPYTFDAFMKYRMNGCEISSCELDVIKKMIKGQKVAFEDSGMSKREWRVFLEVFELADGEN